MATVSMNNRLHDWEKINLVSVKKNGAFVDEYICTNCGISGIRPSLSDSLILKSGTPGNLIRNCDSASRPDQFLDIRIQVTECSAQGGPFKNLTPGSVHRTIKAPKNYSNGGLGYWVMGRNGEPVQLLWNEFRTVPLIRKK